MPSWKKVVISGSDAALNSLNISSALTASGLIYPTTDGTSGQVITTNGAGQLSFSSISSGGTGASVKLSQTSAATTWSFAHNLNEKFPAVTIYDSNDEVIIPQKIDAIDNNNMLIYFSSARTGTAAAVVGGSTVSSSYSLTAVTASYALTASYLEGYISPFPFTGSAQITGSLGITGSVNSSGGFTGSLQGNADTSTSASYATDATSASYANSTTSSSYATNATSASYSNVATSASYSSLATSASHALSADSAISASYSSNSTSASYSVSASYANNTTSASYSNVATSASYALNSTSASYSNIATSSSYALNATSASYSPSSLTASYALSAQNAQDILIYVKNTTGAQINKGTVVRILDSTGDNALIATASYDSEGLSANTLGITNQNITNGGFGYVMTEGTFLGLNTDAYLAGQLLYLGAGGTITGTVPVAPLHAVRLGQVLRVQQNNGSMYVRIDNGYELGELHNVKDTSNGNFYGDLLMKSGSVWTNTKQLSGSYGLTGSLNVTQGVTGSLLGTASYADNATSASYALSSSYAVNSTSASYSNNSTSASYALNTTSASYAVAATSASHALSSNNAISASYALSSSYALAANSLTSGDKTINGNLTITGNVTAQEFYTELVSSSIIYESGSTKFGDSSDDVHSFTGSLRVQGSITGSLFGTSSWASNSINTTSSSYAVSSTSASYALNSTNASNATTAGSSTSASYSLNATSAVSATTAGSATSASYALNATNATSATTATSASYATTATSAASATTAGSATSASYALNATNATSATSATTAGSATSASYALTATSAASATSATSATTATYIQTQDTRSTSSTPATNNMDQGVRFDFKANSTNGLSDGGTYNGTMYFRPYGSTSDWSGGGAHEIGFTANGSLHHRYGTTSWGSWYKILDSNNYTGYNDFGNNNVTAAAFYDANNTAYYVNPASSTRLNGYLSFGIPGNGANANGRWLSIEGNTDVDGEGSGRLFFTEHNSTTGAMDSYGLSIGYRGGATSVTTAGGNTWTGLSAIDNGAWGFWGHDGSTTGALAMYGPRSGAYIAATGDFRAPIFYDLNNTGYYLNPAGNSNLYYASFANDVQMNGNYLKFDQSGTRSWSIRAAGGNLNFTSGDGSGTYTFTGSASFTGGSSWFGGYGGGSGPGLSFENQSTFARIVFWGLDFYDWNHGTQMVIDNGYVSANNSFRAPIFYDSNDTGYYINPASDSKIQNLSLVRSGGGHDPYGVLAVSCPSGDNYSYIGMTRNGIVGLGMGIDTSNNFWIGGTTGGHNAVRSSTNILINSGGVQSPVFYDLNNTGYYVDPASTSNLWDLQLTGGHHTYLYINPGNGYEAMVRYNGGSGNTWYAGKRTTSTTQAGTDGFHFYSDAAGDTVVGFGTDGTIKAKGDVVAYSSSDKQLKDNIKPIENALEKVKQIGGYTFDWNDKQDTYKGHDIGVIAQEIEAILPEVVTTRDSGYKAVKYEKIVPLLIEAIKEQQTQIENQQSQIDELKSLVKQLLG